VSTLIGLEELSCPEKGGELRGTSSCLSAQRTISLRFTEVEQNKTKHRIRRHFVFASYSFSKIGGQTDILQCNTLRRVPGHFLPVSQDAQVEKTIASYRYMNG